MNGIYYSLIGQSRHKWVKSGKMLTERERSRLYELKGLPPDEFDDDKYDGADDD